MRSWLRTYAPGDREPGGRRAPPHKPRPPGPSLIRSRGERHPVVSLPRWASESPAVCDVVGTRLGASSKPLIRGATFEVASEALVDLKIHGRRPLVLIATRSRLGRSPSLSVPVDASSHDPAPIEPTRCQHAALVAHSATAAVALEPWRIVVLRSAVASGAGGRRTVIRRPSRYTPSREGRGLGRFTVHGKAACEEVSANCDSGARRSTRTGLTRTPLSEAPRTEWTWRLDCRSGASFPLEPGRKNSRTVAWSSGRARVLRLRVGPSSSPTPADAARLQSC